MKKIYENKDAYNHPGFSKDRAVYSKWFLEEYARPERKSRLIQSQGEKYYYEVMRIYQERLDENDFNLGPQSVEEWNELREKFSKE